jgi:signal transduction histidine kinase
MTGSDVAGRVVRRLLIATFAVPIIAGAFQIRAREQQLFTRESGVALMVIITMGVLVAVVLQSARVLRRTDREREALLIRERAATREAEAATLVKSQFLATMSHELRTPLSAVIGYSHLMSEGIGGQLSPQHAQQVDRILLSARHLLSLIDQILTLSRLDAGKEALRARTVDVAELVRETVAMAEPLVFEKRLAFMVDAEPAGQIETDPDKARQILLNLLSNAVKFTEQGEVRLHVTRADGHVAFEVSDTGVGIAPEYQERVFDAFWQVEMSHAREKFGTGLGLSVSRQLARLLGGTLTVRSTPGAGSTFRLELPQ